MDFFIDWCTKFFEKIQFLWKIYFPMNNYEIPGFIITKKLDVTRI